MGYPKLNEMTAITIITLCKEHIDKCNGECHISLSLLRPIVEKLLKRPLSKDEEKHFI